MRRYAYDDPTGGGDEITLELPDWAEAPQDIMVGVPDVDEDGEKRVSHCMSELLEELEES